MVLPIRLLKRYNMIQIKSVETFVLKPALPTIYRIMPFDYKKWKKPLQQQYRWIVSEFNISFINRL